MNDRESHIYFKLTFELEEPIKLILSFFLCLGELGNIGPNINRN